MKSLKDLEIRELEPREYALLGKVGMFEQMGLPDMAHAKAVVAITKGPSPEIVAYWIIFDAVHVEPLWVKEEYRKAMGLGLGRRLWGVVQKILVDCGINLAFAIIADQDAAVNMPYATRLGFKRIPGQPFFVEVKPLSEEKPEEDLAADATRH